MPENVLLAWMTHHYNKVFGERDAALNMSAKPKSTIASDIVSALLHLDYATWYALIIILFSSTKDDSSSVGSSTKGPRRIKNFQSDLADCQVYAALFIGHAPHVAVACECCLTFLFFFFSHSRI